MAVNTTDSVAKKNTFARFSMNLGFLIIAVFLLPVVVSVARHTLSDNQQKSWWELRRDSSLQAPVPAEFSDAVIQVYAARAARWRGAFGVHTWIAVKPRGASDYTRMNIVSGLDLTAILLSPHLPDRYRNFDSSCRRLPWARITCLTDSLSLMRPVTRVFRFR